MTDTSNMHPVRRTVVRNAVNVAQPGDLLPASAVEALRLKVGTDDEAEVGPIGAAPEVPAEQQLEFRYDRPVVSEQIIPTAGVVPTVGSAPVPAEEEPVNSRRKTAKSADS